MTYRCGRHGFYLPWLAVGLAMLGAAFLFPADITQTAVVPDTRSGYLPYKVNHFTIGLLPENYDFFFSDKPESLFDYQNAELVVNRTAQLFKAEMRIRGTHAWNWDHRKPSFRLRLRGNKRIMGRQILDFITPDDASMLANLVSDHIAVELGMPSPRTTIATVLLNNDYKGLYHLAEPINVAALAGQGFTDCSVVEGNIRNSKLWAHPEVWEIEPAAGRDPEIARKALAKLLEMVMTPVDLQRIEKMAEVIDPAGFAGWSALMTAIGSIHTNDYFGHLLVFDHKSSRLFPVIADPSGFGVITSVGGMHTDIDIRVPLYEFLTPFLNAFFRVPDFQFQRNLQLYKILQTQLADDKLQKLVDSYLEQLRPLYYKETYASALINIPLVLFSRKIPVSPQFQEKDAARLVSFMKARRAFLLGELANIEAELVKLHRQTSVDGKQFEHLLIRVKGHCPVAVDFTGLPGIVLADADFDGGLESPIIASAGKVLFYPGLTETAFSEPHWLMPGRRRADFLLTPDFQSYVIGVQSENLDETLSRVMQSAENAVTGEKVAIKNVDLSVSKAVQPCSKSLHAWRNLKK